MRFAFTDEQDALRAEARRFLSERVNVRGSLGLAGAHDPDLHAEMVKLGWLDEGLGFLERCILVEETGRALLPGAFQPTTIARLAIERCGSDEQRLAPGAVATYLDEPGALAPCASVAEVVVVRDGLTLSIATPLRASAEKTADLTRPWDRAALTDEQPLPNADVPGVHARAACLVAGESVGVAQRALDMAVAYASERTQFGVPIGSFQAIKHKAADVLRAITSARLLTYRAALAIAQDEPAHAVAVSMAKAAANDGVLLATKENIQIHGGVGVTWEHDAHLLYRRALANQAWFGETAVNRDRVALALLAEQGS